MQEEEPLLLGLLDSRIQGNVTWTDNKVGGLPDWIHLLSHPTCKLCHSPTSLVCQLYCPLGGCAYHRVLYVFACTKKQCWNKSDSWMVFRSQIEDHRDGTEASSNAKGCSSGERLVTTDVSGVAGHVDFGSNEPNRSSEVALDEWGVDTNDWGDDTDTFAPDTVTMVTAQFEDIKLQSEAGSKCNLQFSQCLSARVPGNNDVNSCYDQVVPNNTSLGKPLSEMLQDTVTNLKKDDQGAASCSVDVEDDIVADKKDIVLLQAGVTHFGTDNKQPQCEVQTFASYYINVIEEPEHTNHSLRHEQELLKEYSDKEGVNLTGLMEDWSSEQLKGAEKYEKAEIKHGDRVFHKFLKGVSPCPQQILRYQYNGCPLCISDPKDLLEVPNCEYCGMKRLFELQLMPSLVSLLKVDGHSGVCLEFGAVYIYTCINSCWTTDHPVQNEYVCVHPDPDSKLFKV